jgi:hypothetical protein
MLSFLLSWALVPHADAAEALQSEALQPLVEQLVPLVEEAAGRRFHHVPPVVLADQQTLARVLYEEQRHLLRQLSGVDADHADASAAETAASVSHQFAGKYGFLDKTLYVSLEGIADALAMAQASPELAGQMVQVVLAHELTHALQDQHIDLARMVVDAGTADAVMAANCAVEGHAVYVAEAVADEMGLQHANAVMADVLGYGSGLPTGADGFYSAYVYGLGRDFAAWHTLQGGTDHMWTVLHAPPRATAMIVQPSRYLQPPPPVTDGLPRAVHRAVKRLGRRSWARRSQRLGDYDVRDQLVRSGSGPGLADQVEEAWHARSVGGEMLGVEVQVLRFATPRLAQAYVIDMGRNAAFQAAAVQFDTRVEATAGVFEAVASDVSARERIALTLGGPHELGTVWLAQGTDVVQVITVNRSPPDRRIARAVRPLLRRLKAQPLPEDDEPVLLSRWSLQQR